MEGAAVSKGFAEDAKGKGFEIGVTSEKSQRLSVLLHRVVDQFCCMCYCPAALSRTACCCCESSACMRKSATARSLLSRPYESRVGWHVGVPAAGWGDPEGVQLKPIEA